MHWIGFASISQRHFEILLPWLCDSLECAIQTAVSLECTFPQIGLIIDFVQEINGEWCVRDVVDGDQVGHGMNLGHLRIDVEFLHEPSIFGRCQVQMCIGCNERHMIIRFIKLIGCNTAAIQYGQHFQLSAAGDL